MDYMAPIKALADETRLRLFAVLARHELNVNELTDLFSMGQSRISRHLRILSDAGLLELRRQGQWSFYKREKIDSQVNEMAEKVIALVAGWPKLRDDLDRASALISARNLESKRFFADIAVKRWEAMKADLDGGADLDGYIIDWLEENGTVVDVGCGMGDLILRLKDHCRYVIGVDHAPTMLEQVRNRLHENQVGIDLRIGDAAHLPLGDGEADALILNMVLHHLPQPDRVFRELGRVTRQGGQLLVAELDAHGLDSVARRYGDVWMGFSEPDLRDWLTQGGWELNRCRSVAIGLGMSSHIISAKKISK